MGPVVLGALRSLCHFLLNYNTDNFFSPRNLYFSKCIISSLVNLLIERVYNSYCELNT